MLASSLVRWESPLTTDDFSNFSKSQRAKYGGYTFNRNRAAIVAMFNWADEQDWIERAPKYGKGFRRVARGKLRESQADVMLKADDINALLGVCSKQVFVMILLAVNGGYGPADLRLLEWRMIDLDKGIIQDRRAKTKIRRTVTLWPETVVALKRRRKAGDPLVFRTRHGNQWRAGEISHQVGVAIDRSGLELPKRTGIYALRHTFATLANEVTDTDARKRLMGHRLHGPRLRKVTDHIRQALSIPDLIGDIRQGP